MDAIDKTGTPRSAHDLLMDIQWNCEHCTARLDYEASVQFSPKGAYDDPCKGCRLQKYGYGGTI